MGSLDNPSLLAGKSVVHLFYDESKYDKDEKVNRAMPVLRGDSLTYGASHLFLGLTITTDMPDVERGGILTGISVMHPIWIQTV